MREAFFFCGIGGGDEETLFAYVREYLFELLVGVFAFYETHIDGGDGFFGDYILRLFADISAAQTANIQRRILQKFHQTLAATFGPGELKFALEIGVIIGHGCESVFFRGVERNDVVVKTLDEDLAVCGFHGSEQTREGESGIGRPVSVVAAVQGANCSIGGDLESENSAIAEENQGAAALMYRAVASDEHVGVEKIFVGE